MITNPSLPPLDRLAELADHFTRLSAATDISIFARQEMREAAAICEEVLRDCEDRHSCDMCAADPEHRRCAAHAAA